jgi:hypothetical protein
MTWVLMLVGFLASIPIAQAMNILLNERPLTYDKKIEAYIIMAGTFGTIIAIGYLTGG